MGELSKETLRKDFSVDDDIVDVGYPAKNAFISFKTKASMDRALQRDGDVYKGNVLKVSIADQNKGKGKKGGKGDGKNGKDGKGKDGKGKGKGKDKGRGKDKGKGKGKGKKGKKGFDSDDD